MRLLYEAANSIEAHMILNMIEQAGLKGRIDGEYLQGGVGELQAMGIVRVMVEESDYEQARELVKQWDAEQPKEITPKPENKSYVIGVGILGLVVGLASSILFYNTPKNEYGMDHNGDGILDEIWHYEGVRLRKTTVDRNFDGEPDIIFNYSFVMEKLTSSSADENFDGVFETEITYKNGNIDLSKLDTTGDGYKDYELKYKNGVIHEGIFRNPETGKAVKIQRFNGLKLTSATFDTDGDGEMDKVISYDEIEEFKEEL